MTPVERPSPTVQVDGDAARRIREDKGLTQLYVAEVVGVSVDTISRWENNRTPAVRRENAEALAQALEVAPEVLLRKASAPDPAPDATAGPGRRGSRLAAGLVALGLALTVAAALLWRLAVAPPLVVEATRRLPAYTPPGTEVPVLVTVWTVSGQSTRVILREVLPPGWKLLGASVTPDQGPNPTGVTKWILPLEGRPVRVGYLIRAPDKAPEGSAHRIRGEVVMANRDAPAVPVRGETRIDLESIHWADQDGDFQISDAEVLDALERLEGAQGLGLDPADLRSLWGAEEYAWDPVRRRFRPSPKPR